MSTKRGSSTSPFSGLAALREKLPAGPTPVEKTAAVVKPPARAVVRLEKKQRRGKEVTVVEKLDLKPADLERWCRELKGALGCGGTVEEGAIVLQGDLRARLPDLLSKRGVVKVILG